LGEVHKASKHRKHRIANRIRSNQMKHVMPNVCGEIEGETASFPQGTCSRHAAHSPLAGDKGQLGRRVDQGKGHDSTAGPVRMTEGYQACHGQPGAAWLGGTAGSEQILLVSTDGDLWTSGWNEHGSETPKGPDLRVCDLGLGSGGVCTMMRVYLPGKFLCISSRMIFSQPQFFVSLTAGFPRRCLPEACPTRQIFSFQCFACRSGC
jgi:hypothetical protein